MRGNTEHLTSASLDVHHSLQEQLNPVIGLDSSGCRSGNRYSAKLCLNQDFIMNVTLTHQTKVVNTIFLTPPKGC